MTQQKVKVLWFESNHNDLNFLIPKLIERLGYDLIITQEKGDVKSWLSDDEVDESWFLEIEQIFVEHRPIILIKFFDDAWDYGHDFCRLVRTSQLGDKIGLLFINPLAFNNAPQMVFPDIPCRADAYLRVVFSIEEFREIIENLIIKYKPNET